MSCVVIVYDSIGRDLLLSCFILIRFSVGLRHETKTRWNLVYILICMSYIVFRKVGLRSGLGWAAWKQRIFMVL